MNDVQPAPERSERSWILDVLYAEYGSWYAISKALNTSNQRINQWAHRGYIPEQAALEVEGLGIEGIDVRAVCEEAQKYRG